MSKLRCLTALVVCAFLTSVVPAHADVVTDWNAITTQIVAVGDPTTTPATPPARGGPPSLLDIALVHLAMHDAVQAIEGRYQPYSYSTPGSGSVAAAAAAAAHRTLVLLYPAKQAMLDSLYSAYLTSHTISTTDPGLAVGEAAAIALHSNHYRPLIPIPDFFGNNSPGQWRSAVPMAFLFMAFSEPFALNRVSQFRPEPPPPMRSTRYVREYDEVKTIGDGAAQSAAQLSMGRFWSGNFPAQWNEALRRIAINNVNNIGDSARLFALANVAGADAGMAVWDSKYFYNFWRPSMAIQDGALDGNSRTQPQAGWVTYFSTLPVTPPNPMNPPYPDYVSGANGLTGAFTGMLQEFFATDDISFSVKSIPAQAANPERFFTSFSQAAQEVVDARILLGIHFRSADEDARQLGIRVAHWTFQKFLRPVPGSK
jgi:hypothetical protein